MVRKNKIIFAIGYAIAFAIGGYVWKVVNTGHNILSQTSSGGGIREFGANEAIVYIGDTVITADDVQWEYLQHTEGLVNEEQLTFIPEVGNKLNEYLAPLKERLATGLIERKLLFKMIEADTKFDTSDPSRYVSCIQEWQQAIEGDPKKYEDPKAKERLKARICEASLIKQYTNEKLFKDIKVNEKDVIDYYNKHPSEFSQPQKAVIRQVVLATEEDAKKVRAKINISNFASLAREYSITPEGEDGGILGPFALSDVPRVFDIAFSMRKGDISDVLKSNYGFHIITLEKKIPVEKLSLSEAKTRIEKKLLRQHQEEEYQKWVELALNTISVKAPKPAWEQ